MRTDVLLAKLVFLLAACFPMACAVQAQQGAPTITHRLELPQLPPIEVVLSLPDFEQEVGASSLERQRAYLQHGETCLFANQQ